MKVVHGVQGSDGQLGARSQENRDRIGNLYLLLLLEFPTFPIDNSSTLIPKKVDLLFFNLKYFISF